MWNFFPRVGATNTGPKECLRALVKRLNHPDPHVVVQAITLLDACVNNCGRYFLLEVSLISQLMILTCSTMWIQVASREFETEFRKLLGKSHPKVAEKLKAMLKRWNISTARLIEKNQVGGGGVQQRLPVQPHPLPLHKSQVRKTWFNIWGVFLLNWLKERGTRLQWWRGRSEKEVRATTGEFSTKVGWWMQDFLKL